MQGVDVCERKAVPHGAADDWIRVVFRQDRAEHVERTDVGRGLAAPVRVRGEDEVCERLPQHDENKYSKSPPKAGEDSRKKKMCHQRCHNLAARGEASS